jgi:hypothetical protein
MTSAYILDRHGRAVTVGTRVRVLEVPASLLSQIPADEGEDLLSMVGEVLEVFEIDDFGGAWVEKEWHSSADGPHSQSIALASHEMEVV